MSSFEFVLPDDFADYESEVESKGWFGLARIVVSGKTYEVLFYDPIRLAQEIDAELQGGPAFCEANLIVVPSVTRASMERAARWLVESGCVASLAPSADS